MQKNIPNTAAIILAAGSGRRMGSDKTKQTLTIAGKTVLRHCLEAFESSSRVNSIVVVYKDGELDFVNKECHFLTKPFTLVKGGKCRAESASLGFYAASENADYVMIHDAARCLITPGEINSVLDAAIKHGAATASRAVTDTVKRCDAEGRITDTLPRSEIRTVQTPQAFSKEVYREALKAAALLDEAVTDDNMLVEAIGVKPYCVQTLSTNIKITAGDDLPLAEMIIKMREECLYE